MEITTNLVLHGTQINKGSVNRGHVSKDPEAEAKLTSQGGITVALFFHRREEKRKHQGQGTKGENGFELGL